MTSVMLATYPEVFAGGAVIAGLPFGVASNVREALNGMLQSPSHPAGELGDLVRNASHHQRAVAEIFGLARQRRPHGQSRQRQRDRQAVARRASICPLAPMSEGIVDGYPHQVWWNADGETIVESYTITDMAHGTPLGIADNDERYGAQGAFLIEAGISSSYHIASFFGLTEWIASPGQAPRKLRSQLQGNQRLRKSRFRGLLSAPARTPDIAAALQPLTTLNRPAKPVHGRSRAPRDRCRRA